MIFLLIQSSKVILKLKNLKKRMSNNVSLSSTDDSELLNTINNLNDQVTILFMLFSFKRKF